MFVIKLKNLRYNKTTCYQKGCSNIIVCTRKLYSSITVGEKLMYAEY